MDIKGKLDTEFFNLGHDAHGSESIDVREYTRVERCWNIYYHGFMDEYDDIAYVKGKVSIEPGIYEIVTYGIPALLFVWRYATEVGQRDLKGLIVKADDTKLIEDAYTKYKTTQAFI